MHCHKFHHWKLGPPYHKIPTKVNHREYRNECACRIFFDFLWEIRWFLYFCTLSATWFWLCLLTFHDYEKKTSTLILQYYPFWVYVMAPRAIMGYGCARSSISSKT